MYGEGRMVDLVYLCTGLKSIPELKDAPLEKILVDGIRNHTQDSKSPLHFWARFSSSSWDRQRDEPSDMLVDADPKNVRFDPGWGSFCAAWPATSTASRAASNRRRAGWKLSPGSRELWVQTHDSRVCFSFAPRTTRLRCDL